MSSKTPPTPRPHSARATFSLAGSRITLARKTAAAAKPAGGAAEADGEPRVTLEGYPILWNTLSSDRGDYKVRLMPGSAVFADPTLALYHHVTPFLLGNSANGTLRWTADDVGIKVEIDLPDTTVARDVAELVEDKYLSGMSFSMANGFEEFNEAEEDGQNVISVLRFTCDEVTITPTPAFTDTSVALKDPAGEEVAEGESSDDDSASDPAPTQRVTQSARWERSRLSLYDL